MNKHEKVKEEEKFSEDEQCSCDCEECNCNDDESISIKDVAYHADDKIDALIHLLIKKKIFSESEFEEEYNALFEDDGEEETD